MPPPQSETSTILQGYLEALRQSDRARQRALASARPDLTEDFAAIERAYSRLGPALYSVGDQADSSESGKRKGATSRGPMAEGGSAGSTPLGLLGAAGRPPAGASAPHPEAPSQFLGALPEPGVETERGPEALLSRLDQHASSFERYSDGTEIARGGMGSIRRVWDTDLRRQLVMKVMLSEQDRNRAHGSRPPDPRLLTRFLEEAQITAQLDHPGILPVHDIGVDPEGRLYFTMPLVIGQELGKAIDMMRQGQSDWTLARLLNHLRTAMEAVAFAHSRGVIHRDLKPENVMVGRFGETYVMDWGLARVMGSPSASEAPATATSGAESPETVPVEPLARVSTERFEGHESKGRPSVETLDGDVVGTPGYMAPEQARGQRELVGANSDVYSMGAIMYQVLTGYRPFGDPLSKASGRALFELILAHELVPIRRLEKGVPGELVAIAEKAMAHAPEARYASMVEMAEDLRAFLEGRVVLAYERGLAARVKKWVKRNRLASLAFSLVAGGALVGTGAFIWQQQYNLEKLTTERNAAQMARREALDKSILAENARADEAQQRELAQQREAEAKFNLEQKSIEKDSADRAREHAEEQRQLAKQQSEEARESAELARHSTYAANLLAAQLALSAGNLAEARRGIDACASELRGFEWQHLRQQTDASRMSLTGHRGAVLDLALNPGEFVASSGADGTVRLWDSASGAPLMQIRAPRGPARLAFDCVAVAPGSGRLALARADGRLFFVESGNGSPSAAPDCPLPLAAVRELEFSPDGRWLALTRAASGAQPARLDLFDLLAGKWLASIALGEDRPSALAWDPRGRRLALGCLSGAVLVVDVERGRTLVRTGAEQRKPISAVAFGAGGSSLCAVSLDGELDIFDVEGGGVRLASLRLPEAAPRAICVVDYDPDQALLGANDGPRSALWRPTRSLLAVGNRSGILRLYDLDSGLEINTLKGHTGPISALAFDPLSESLVSSSDDGTLKLWDPYQSQALTTVQSQATLDLPGLLFADQDRALISWRSASSGRRHDARSPLDHRRMSPSTPLSFGPFASYPGARLFAVSAGAPIELSTEDGSELSRGPASPQPVWAAALSPEGSLLALCVESRAGGPGSSAAGRVQALIFAVPAPGAPWERPQVLPLGERVPQSLALSSQKQTLILQFDDGTLAVHQLATGNALQQLSPPAVFERKCQLVGLQQCAQLIACLNSQMAPRPPGPVECAGSLLLDPRHDRLVQACGDTAWLWPIEFGADGQARLAAPSALNGHRSPITALALSPDGGRLVTASEDGQMRIWDPLLGQSLIELPGPGTELCALAFSTDGRRLASLSTDGELRLFETRPMGQLRAPRESGPTPLLGALRQLPAARQLETLLAQRQRGLAALGGLLEGAAEVLSNPARTLADCWRVASDPSRDRAEYERALADYEAALPRAAPAPIYHRTRAALALRLGEPIASLDSIDLAVRAGLSDRPDLYSIQTLAALRAGLRPLAIEAHERAKGMLKEDFWSRDLESQAWFAEAEAALDQGAFTGPSGE